MCRALCLGQANPTRVTNTTKYRGRYDQHQGRADSRTTLYCEVQKISRANNVPPIHTYTHTSARARGTRILENRAVP